MKIGLNLKVDVTKLDKSKFFHGKNGAVYADLTAFVDLVVQGQYGDDQKYMFTNDQELWDHQMIDPTNETGEELDIKKTRDPHLNEWLIMSGNDGGETVSLWIDRWRYPSFKHIVWKIQPKTDIVVVRGYKPGWRSARTIQIKQLWVLEVDDE